MFNYLGRYAENLSKQGTSEYFSARFNRSEHVNEHIGLCGSVHHSRPFDDEFGDPVDTQLTERLDGSLDLVAALLTVQKRKNCVVLRFFVVVPHLVELMRNRSRQPGKVVQRMAVHKIVHVEKVVHRFAHVQSPGSYEVLDQPVRRHGAPGEAVEVEMGDPSLEAASLEVVTLLLALPSLNAAPFFDQSVAIGLDERLGFVVVRLEEERHAKDRER